MKKLNVLISLLLLAFCTATTFAQTEVKVAMNDGSSSSIIVSDLGKLYFSPETLFVNDGNGTPQAFAISDIRKVTFTTLYDDIETFQNSNDILIYPNPAETSFKVASSNTEQMHLVLYSIAGQKLIDKYISANEAIDISQLRSGIYLVQVNDTNFKLCKK